MALFQEEMKFHRVFIQKVCRYIHIRIKTTFYALLQCGFFVKTLFLEIFGTVITKTIGGAYR